MVNFLSKATIFDIIALRKF